MPSKANKKRVAIYSRCSTQEQQPEVQLQQLRTYSEARGWTISQEIIDHGYSGGDNNRPGLKKLLSSVRKRNVDVVCVVKMDRLFRSLQHLISVLSEFDELGVEFVSVSDQIDFTTAIGKLHLQIIGAFAEFEKDLIRERTLAGLAYAKSIGKILGRPKICLDKEILKLREEKMSYRQIEKQLGCSNSVIRRTIKDAFKSGAKKSNEQSEDNK